MFQTFYHCGRARNKITAPNMGYDLFRLAAAKKKVLTLMRRIISLVLALSLVVAGAIGLFYLIVHPHGARSWGYMATGFLLAVGATWFYLDFIRSNRR
jgi:hypothetical protein